MTSRTCSLTAKGSDAVTVMPNILIDDTISGSNAGSQFWSLRLLFLKIISSGLLYSASTYLRDVALLSNIDEIWLFITSAWNYNILKYGLPFNRHIKTAEQRTIMQQYGDWWLVHWPFVGGLLRLI